MDEGFTAAAAPRVLASRLHTPRPPRAPRVRAGLTRVVRAGARGRGVVATRREGARAASRRGSRCVEGRAVEVVCHVSTAFHGMEQTSGIVNAYHSPTNNASLPIAL